MTGGTVTSSGADSPGIYSTGVISISDATISSTGTEAAVIEGFNSITLNDTDLTGGVQKTGGVMIYQSFSGDAEVGTGTFYMNGSSLTVPEGPVFFVTNTDAEITLTNTDVTSISDVLVNATATSRWGTEGENGGHVSLIADNQELTGSLIADEMSSIDISLQNSSSLSGSVSNAGCILDKSSTWNVTGNSALTTLGLPGEISGDTIQNIMGNGFTVTYDKTLTENSPLGGKIYALENGGTLVPK